MEPQVTFGTEEGWRLWGAADPWRWAGQEETGPTPDYRTRGQAGHEVEDCLRALRAAGMERVIWGLGGDRVAFHPREADAERMSGAGRALAERCALRAAVTFARREGMTLYGRLHMNAHGTEGMDGCASAFFGGHPQWHEADRSGRPDATRLSFFFEEVRRERVAVLAEAARAGLDGVCLDFCRRPPHVRYHPSLVREYVVTGGPDPLRLALTDESFSDWCRFRAAFVTRLLRDLRAALEAAAREQGRRAAVMVQVPDDGLDLNLAAGMDLRAWCRGGLVDAVYVSPLRWLAMDYPDTVEPYVALGAETHTAVAAGANLGAAPGRWNVPAAMERSLKLYREGVAALVLEGAQKAVRDVEVMEALTALRDPERMERLVAEGRAATGGDPSIGAEGKRTEAANAAPRGEAPDYRTRGQAPDRSRGQAWAREAFAATEL